MVQSVANELTNNMKIILFWFFQTINAFSIIWSFSLTFKCRLRWRLSFVALSHKTLIGRTFQISLQIGSNDYWFRKWNWIFFINLAIDQRYFYAEIINFRKTLYQYSRNFSHRLNDFSKMAFYFAVQSASLVLSIFQSFRFLAS